MLLFCNGTMYLTKLHAVLEWLGDFFLVPGFGIGGRHAS